MPLQGSVKPSQVFIRHLMNRINGRRDSSDVTMYLQYDMQHHFDVLLSMQFQQNQSTVL